MSTLTKLALGALGKLHPVPAAVAGWPALALPAPQRTGGMPLLDTLAHRCSAREFRPDPLSMDVLSTLLWAGFGINRPDDGGRTAPSAMNGQEIDVYAAMASGLYHYDPRAHELRMSSEQDVRRVTGYQDFVDDAPLDLIYVADHTRMSMVPASKREAYACVAAGAIAQNIYLYCASAGLSTVIRAWIDRNALAQAMSLTPDHQVLLAQTVGYAKPGTA